MGALCVDGFTSCSVSRVRGTSTVEDYTLAAEACLPIVSAVLAEIKNKTYPRRCFLNIDVPTNIRNHKGYKLTTQGKSIFRMGWKQVNSSMRGKMLSTMAMDVDSSESPEMNPSAVPPDQLLFRREVIEHQISEDDIDVQSLKEGYISVTPLGGVSPAEVECQTFFNDWLPGVLECTFSAL